MKNLLVTSILAIFLVGFISVPGAFAQTPSPSGGASVSFDPPGGNIPLGTEFTVDVIVSTGGQDSAGADVTVKYDTSKLDFVSGTYPGALTGTFYPNPVINPIAANSGKIGMARTVSTPASGDIIYTNGTGTFASLVFKTKATAQIGDTVTFSFEYNQGASNDFTNVANATTPVADLLGTTTLPTATYTIGEGGPVAGDDPVITGIQPSSGKSDQVVQVTVLGSNFGTFVDGESKVYLGTKLTNIVSWTDTQIVFEVAAEPDLQSDSLRQVKVHRADGAEATFLGYKLIAAGPEVFIWGGITMLAMLMAFLAYRRMNQPVMAMAGMNMAPTMQLPIMNYQVDNPTSQITYRNQI